MKKILIVDDISENRYLLESLLDGHGYQVLTAADGSQALELALSEGTPPDLIISDILMPVMDGFELCRLCKQNERLKHVPFVIYTATYTDPKDEHLAMSLGADRFLVKPLKVDELLREVREVLEVLERSQRDPGDQGSVMPFDEMDLLRQYKDALSRKLEKRVSQLEAEIAHSSRVESALRESTALMHIAGRMARLGGWSVSLDDMGVFWSDEVATIHEMPMGHRPSLEEWMGFFTPKWQERITEVFEACAKEGTSYDEEMEIITASGRRAWVRTIGEALRDSTGTITKVQGAFQEITDRKQAETDRQKLQSQLLAAQRIESIGRLAGGVAHDFNNLLSVVLGHAAFALEMLHENDPLRADIEEIRKAGERASDVTLQLLAFSRKQILEPRVINLNKTVTGIERLLSRLLGEDVEVQAKLGQDLGNVMADPGQMEQVLMNLAVNARDAMPKGGSLIIETENVEVDEDYAAQHMMARPGCYVRISVSDSGVGMDAATRERIFDPFFTTKETGKGTGLGLSIVYGIVKQSGGDIWVYSEPEQGTTFRIHFPVVEAEAVEVDRHPVSVMSTGDETVLIVEDEDGVRKIAERILRAAGYQTLTASNGGEALLECERLEGKLHLLVTDVLMPKMGGRELSERLTRMCPGLKTLYMSGYTDSAIVQNGVLAPGTHFIAKPFSMAELTRMVRKTLDA